MLARKPSIRLMTVLTAAVFFLTGCGLSVPSTPVIAGQTLSSNPKWINSDIDGAIDRKTDVRLQDDFYTAVNRSWLLQTDITESKPEVSTFTANDDLLRSRKLDIIHGTDSADTDTARENPSGISESLLQHDQELIRQFADLAGDWSSRDRLGIEPIRPYLNAIAQIQDLNDMTAYLLNEDGMNFTLDYPVEFSVTSPLSDKSGNSRNTVLLSTDTALSLKNQDEYVSITEEGLLNKECTGSEVNYVLSALGYSDRDIRKILRDSYRYESRLAEKMKSSGEQSSPKYADTADNPYTFAQLNKLEGAYPLTAILEHYGLQNSSQYTVCEPSYVKAVGKLYQAKYLPEMKSYYMVRTIMEMLPLLDRRSYEKSVEIEKMLSADTKEDKETPKNPTGDDTDSSEDDNAILLDHFIGVYLPEPLDQIYIADYCSQQDRDDIRGLVKSIIAYYRIMLQKETWLSQKARNNTVDKLDNICIRVLYPDRFTDYSGLSFRRDGNLVDAVAAIRSFRLQREAKSVDLPVDRSSWDMSVYSTTITNAYYNPYDNSINILAGIIADGSVYSSGFSYEEKLGRLGFIIGHEITHAFDSNGAQYDKNGKYTLLWDLPDYTKFQQRCNQLVVFYNALTPYPGAVSYSGTNVQSEATADMGGMKCMLALAKQHPGFDYQKFFTAFAQMWRCKDSYEMEKANASDVHPLSFMRTNVTLQQFDEFNETFGIGRNDGMYLDPDRRVPVW